MKLKNYKLKLFIFKTKNLSTLTKRKIINLKKKYYKFSLKSQKKWFKKNVNENDIHIVLMVDKNMIGYNLLREKKCLIESNKKKILNTIFIFDTLIIDKNFRNKGFSKIIMKKSNGIINAKKKLSILVCFKNLIIFYKQFGWKILTKKKLKYNHLKKNKFSMFYGKNLNLTNIKKITIL